MIKRRHSRRKRGKRRRPESPPELAVGKEIEVTVTGIGPGGWGIVGGRGHRLFVRGGLPGDRVLARVMKRERGRVEARVVRLIAGAIERISPRCAHFQVCGGCLWQDLNYADQLILKKEIVEHCFCKAGVRGCRVEDVVGAEAIFAYRNKMDFSFGAGPDDQLTLGLFEAPWKARTDGAGTPRGALPPVFDLERCWLQSEQANRIVPAVREALRKRDLQAYSPNTDRGTLRSLVIREGKATGEVLVHLTAATDCSPAADGAVEVVSEANGGVSGMVLSVNRRRSRHADPESQQVVAGRGWVWERIAGLHIRVSPNAFLQVNTSQAERLYALAVAFAGLAGHEHVLDLYCGTGTLTMLLARQAARVTGVEVVAQAVEDAGLNAKHNGVANCRFVCGDVLKVLPDLAEAAGEVEVVTVNPSRAGIFRAVVQGICRMGPERVVYISCNPETLARDLIGFQKGGYRPDRVQPVDLFPHTPHCEVVVRLSRSH